MTLLRRKMFKFTKTFQNSDPLETQNVQMFQNIPRHPPTMTWQLLEEVHGKVHQLLSLLVLTWVILQKFYHLAKFDLAGITVLPLMRFYAIEAQWRLSVF